MSYEKFYRKPHVDRNLMKWATEVSKWKSILLGILIYVAVIFLGFIGGELSGWVLAPVSVLVIAALQNHLLILFHEGSHWLVHPNRKWNDFWTDLLCGAPLFQYVRNYRLFHWTHHRSTGEPGVDPEIEIYKGQDFFYERRGALATAWMFAKDLIGINLVRFQISMYSFLFRQAKEQGHQVSTPRELGLFILFWVPVGFLTIYFDLWLYLLIFWILPMFTVMFLLLKLHVYGEHTGLSGPTEFERTWFHGFNPLVDFFIYPIRSGYHIEHHVYPTVPWYNMVKFRSELIKNGYYTEQSERVWADGFFFGKRTIFGSMIYGQGKYTDEPAFRQALDQRKSDIRQFDSKQTDGRQES